MFYPIMSRSLEDILKTLMTNEIVKEVYDNQGSLMGWIVIDTVCNPFSTGCSNITIIRCCMNCDHNEPGKSYCNLFKDSRRYDSVCKCWMKSSSARSKKVFVLNRKTQ